LTCDCRLRDIIADYGPSLTIFAFTAFTFIPSFSSVNVVRINIPTSFNTTSGRPWIVDLNHEDLSAASKGLAFFPALVLTALYAPSANSKQVFRVQLNATNRYFFDHNVSALLTHRIEYKLKKRVCYDWDFMVLGFMMIVCGFLGLPPCNGLIPNSPMHSKALVVYKSRKQLEMQCDQLPKLRPGVPRRDSAANESHAAAALELQQTEAAKKGSSPESRYGPRRKTFDNADFAPDRPPSGWDVPRLNSAVKKRNSDATQCRDATAAELEGIVEAGKRLSPVFDHVVDQRLSNLLQSGLVAIMLLLLPVRCAFYSFITFTTL
jgi:hypothetical protein